MSHPRMAAPAVLLAGLMAAGPVLADKHEPPAVGFSAAVAAEARHLVENAASVAHKMASDERMADLLEEAKGVFIVPNLLKGGLIVGGRGGEGVLLVRNNETWSNPAFFRLGALTLGAQAGSAEGPLAMLLMSDEAVRSFWRDDSFALDASAGLSIYRYDLLARAETGKGDVIVWSDQGGASPAPRLARAASASIRTRTTPTTQSRSTSKRSSKARSRTRIPSGCRRSSPAAPEFRLQHCSTA